MTLNSYLIKQTLVNIFINNTIWCETWFYWLFVKSNNSFKFSKKIINNPGRPQLLPFYTIRLFLLSFVSFMIEKKVYIDYTYNIHKYLNIQYKLYNKLIYIILWQNYEELSKLSIFKLSKYFYLIFLYNIFLLNIKKFSYSIIWYKYFFTEIKPSFWKNIRIICDK